MKELNERQILICDYVGLPTSYDKLTFDQKKKIMRIERLLKYLDEKYDETFNYLGYYEPFLEKEKLEAYSSQLGAYDFVTLIVQSDGSFVDDYPFQFIKRLVREDIMCFLNNETNLLYKAYVVNGYTDITSVPINNISLISGNTWVSFTIFVSTDNPNQYAEIIGEKISEWYKKNNICGSTNVIPVNSETFETINYRNFRSIKREQGAKNLLTCDVNEYGIEKIR
ncbi:MAG: hypothetical protein K5756_04580 [Clostridiales bacterium]|nr:hypothetical protein [Clostridiales bacterium]